MSKEQFKHIFDNSTCLTKRQLKDYVGGTMTNEEAHAAEVHLNSCPLCSDAVEGLFEKQEGGLATMTGLNTDFLKDHFGLHNPQIHLNSIAATHSHSGHYNKKKAKVQPIWRSAAIAASLLLIVAAFWYYRMMNESMTSSTIAGADVTGEPAQNNMPAPDKESAIAMVADVDDNKTKQPEEKDKKAETTTVAPAPAAMMAPAAPAATPAEQKEENKPGFFKRMADKAHRMVEETSTATVLNAMKDPDKTKYETSARNQQNDEQRAVPKGVEDEAVVTQQYKVPLIEKKQTEVATKLSAEDVQKMPARSTNDVASTSAGVYSAHGNSYHPENNSDRTERTKALKPKDAEPNIDRIAQADKLYSAKSYGDALNVYTQEMRGADNKGRRQVAAVGAARCYVALGKTTKAKEILESIVNEGGPQKREAKRLLKELE